MERHLLNQEVWGRSEDELYLSEKEESSKSQLAWTRKQSSEDDLEDYNSHFRFKWNLFRKLYNAFVVIENQAFLWSGYCPHFEQEVLFDKCKSFTFSFSRLWWERVYNNTRPLNSSIRAKRFNQKTPTW